MIKIAHIANPASGVGVYLDLLVKHSNEQKFEHLLLYNPEETSDGFQFRNAYQILLKRPIHLTDDVKCFFQIIKILKTIDPDCVHCHSAKAGILGRLAGAYLGIPTFYTPHAYSYLSAESKFKRMLYKTIEKSFRLLKSKTIACSNSEYLRTINDLKFKKNKALLWSNSIDVNLTSLDIENSINLPKEFLCSVGRVSYQKNTSLLVEAILEVKKKIENIKLVILGVGHYSPQFEEINNLIYEYHLNDNITLVSWLDRKEVFNIIDKCKIFISTSRYEGLPYTVLEAMALSKPCIVTDVDGNKDLIRDRQNGSVVQEEAKLIANAIVELYSNDELLAQMSLKTRTILLENYDINKNISELESIYLSAIQNFYSE